MNCRHKIILIVVIFVVGIPALSQNDSVVSPYRPGERLSYLIHYGIINAGNAILYIEEDTLQNQDVNHILISGWTTGLADALFKVRDTYESYVDPGSDLPVKAIRNISEGRYKKYNEVIFDRKTRDDSTILHSQASGMQVVEKNIHDILSSIQNNHT